MPKAERLDDSGYGQRFTTMPVMGHDKNTWSDTQKLMMFKKGGRVRKGATKSIKKVKNKNKNTAIAHVVIHNNAAHPQRRRYRGRNPLNPALKPPASNPVIAGFRGYDPLPSSISQTILDRMDNGFKSIDNFQLALKNNNQIPALTKKDMLPQISQQLGPIVEEPEEKQTFAEALLAIHDSETNNSRRVQEVESEEKKFSRLQAEVDKSLKQEFPRRTPSSNMAGVRNKKSSPFK
jgi:hypothetical protein